MRRRNRFAIHLLLNVAHTKSRRQALGQRHIVEIAHGNRVAARAQVDLRIHRAHPHQLLFNLSREAAVVIEFERRGQPLGRRKGGGRIDHLVGTGDAERSVIVAAEIGPPVPHSQRSPQRQFVGRVERKLFCLRVPGDGLCIGDHTRQFGMRPGIGKARSQVPAIELVVAEHVEIFRALLIFLIGAENRGGRCRLRVLHAQRRRARNQFRPSDAEGVRVA